MLFLALGVILMETASTTSKPPVTENSQGFNMLANRHMTVGVLPNLPYVTLKRHEGKVSDVGGFVPEIVKWLAEKHQFSFEYVVPPDGAYGALVNGSWNGLIGLISKGEIDIAGTDLSITYPRSFVVDFSYSYANDPVALLVPYPQLASTITGVVRPFQYEVWIGVILSLFVAAFVLWLIKKIESRTINTNKRKNEGKISDEIFFLFRVLANADEKLENSQSIRILLASWCLVAFVLIQSYTSCLVAYLTAPKFIPFVNSVEELANSNEIVTVVRKYTSIESDLTGATSGPLAKLGNQLRIHPERLIENIDNLEDLVANERKVVPWAESVQKMTVYNDFKKTNQCRLALAKEHLYDDRCAFALPKSSPMTKIFNHDLLLMQQSGLLGYWKDFYLPKPNRCSVQLSSLRPLSTNTRLTLNYLSSAFILYGVGIVLSVFVFGHEFIIYCYQSI